MSDDEYRIIAISALNTQLSSGKLSFPISSADLLSRVVATRIPTGLLPDSSSPTTKFRLVDQSRFDFIIESLSQTWDQGVITIARDNGEMTILDITLVPSGSLFPFAEGGSGEASNPLKRKRVIDEDADSAAGEEDAEELLEDYSELQQNTPLGALNKELRDVYTILQQRTARGRLLAERFHSRDERFEPICTYITKDECAKSRRLNHGVSPSGNPPAICDRVHFRPLIRPHTDITLGHCSYLNTCYSEPTYAQSPSIPPFPGSTHSHGQAPPNTRGPVSLPSGLGAGGRGKEKAPCRYLHYEIDWDGGDGDWSRNLNGKGGYGPARKRLHKLDIGMGPAGKDMRVLPPQWINCDLRRFDYSVLGKFHVIMADPPWDIHMSLPYGTMTDDEMRAMPIPTLQDEGLLFLWVTGRAMEVGRECLRVWGYTRVDEVVWVKTNQLQRVIRTGRTGHWLNHTKEHMLVGVKTVIDQFGVLKFPSWANRGLDTDVIVSEVRETSRKPEEVYGLIERMCPGGRKIEIFGRKHNTRPGWLTLGNQLGPDQIYEEDLAVRIKAKYPDRNITPLSQAQPL
ncbi:MT-A70-domain-containing protein [Collybia nuda]|uniref:mRNA m(6)A methyltransferase n=1 Tax=Collybia nuda TaxID=64659 RepID=A0A9P5YHB5_9AGAR|nr:MT-A70-domain-containing protein [Collybia nuda]